MQSLFISSQNTHRLDVRVYGQGTVGLDFDETYSRIGSTLIEVGPAAPTAIPGCIRDSVGLWVEGTASDGEFVGAIQFLIRQGAIVVPETEVLRRLGRDAGVDKGICRFVGQRHNLRRRVRQRDPVPDTAGSHRSLAWRS